MMDESQFQKTVRAMNLRWLQEDRKYRWMLTNEGGTLFIKRNVKVRATGKRTFQPYLVNFMATYPKPSLKPIVRNQPQLLGRQYGASGARNPNNDH